MATFTIRGPVWIAAIALSLALWATIGYAVGRSVTHPDGWARLRPVPARAAWRR